MTNSAPRVSVCLLSFNSGGRATFALQSVLETDYPNVEIICVDDHSTDGSYKELKTFAELNGAEFIRNEKNLGIAASCNVALGRATGKYILVLGDDLIMPNRISGDVRILESRPELTFVSSKLLEIDWVGEPIVPDRRKGQRKRDRGEEGLVAEDVRWVWIRGSRILTPTVTFRLSALRSLGGWDESYQIEDRPLYLKLASEGHSGWFRDEVTTKYRIHPGNYSRRFRQDFVRSELRLLRENRVSLPTWLIHLKILLELHHWMLSHRLEQVTASASLRSAGIGHLDWLLSSRLIKSLFVVLSYLFASSGLNREVRNYFRG